MAYKFHILDVFTDQKYSGNQLAVVEDCDDLGPDQMQAIAREFNLSETVFLQTSDNPVAAARLRIFTPTQEIPFAGHPTVGTAILLGELNNGRERQQDSLMVLEEGLGLVRCGIKHHNDGADFAEFDVPQLPIRGREAPEPDQLADSLNLERTEIGFENHKPLVATCGINYVLIPVHNLKAAQSAVAETSRWEEIYQDFSPFGVYLYCRETVAHDADFHARMFAPTMGVPEDPATGSAAAAFAHAIMAFEPEVDGLMNVKIEQGTEMGRSSFINLEIERMAHHLKNVRIGGHAVRVMRGELL